MSLKIAIVWSTVLHLGLLTLRPPQGLSPPRAALHTLEVSYIPAAPRSGLKASPAKERPVPSPLGPEVRPVRPAEVPSPILPPATPIPPLASRLPLPVSQPRPTVSSPPVHSVATVLPAWDFSALEHKERVRAHLKRHLRYPAGWVEGTVRIRLLLTAEGILQSAEVLEASDPRLTQAALGDIRSAAPYPRFLPGMKRRSAAYEFLVRYQPE